MEINWIAVLVAAASTLVLGFVWYNPKVFGNAWMKGLGFSEEDLKKSNMAILFGLSYVFAVLLAFFIAIQVDHSHGSETFNTFKHGAFHGVFIGLLVALPVLATNALYERQGFKLIAINVGYWILNCTVMGGILAAW